MPSRASCWFPVSCPFVAGACGFAAVVGTAAAVGDDAVAGLLLRHLLHLPLFLFLLHLPHQLLVRVVIPESLVGYSCSEGALTL